VLILCSAATTRIRSAPLECSPYVLCSVSTYSVHRLAHTACLSPHTLGAHTSGDSDRGSVHPSGEEDYEIVPSALHKYSARMHGSHFSYFSQDEPLVVPSFNLDV
jgi:hypothetical protein